MSCIGKTNEITNKDHVLTLFASPIPLKRIHLFAGSEPGRDELKGGTEERLYDSSAVAIFKFSAATTGTRIVASWHLVFYEWDRQDLLSTRCTLDVVVSPRVQPEVHLVAIRVFGHA